MGRLRILTDGVEPAVLELPAGTTTLGRREDNPLCLPDGSVSSRHCELSEADGQLTIRDLASTNGTFINGERAEQGTVAPGGTFKLGGVELRYEVDAPAASPAPVEKAPPPPAPAPDSPPVIEAPKLPALVAPPVPQPAPVASAVAPAPPKLSPAEALKQSLAKATPAPAPPSEASPASVTDPASPPAAPGSAKPGFALKFTLGDHKPAAPASDEPTATPAASAPAPVPKPGGPKVVPTGEPPKFSLGGHKPAASPAAAPAAAPVVPTDGPAKLSLGGSHKLAPAAEPAPVAPPPPAKAAPPALAKGGKPCARHAANAAQYICPKCRTHSCDECVKVHESVNKRTVFCPVCANKALPLAEFAQIQGAKQVREDLPFHQQLKGVFRYPFSKGGLAMLIIGTLLFCTLDFLVTWGWKMRFIMLKVIPYVGIIATFSAGYLCAYLQKILQATAQGEDDVPGWPEFSQWWDDIVAPFRLVVVSFVASFGPAFAYMILHAANDTEMSLTILFPLFALGFLYFPMALLAAAMSNNWFAVNPLVVLPAITRLNLQYVLATAVFFALVLARFLSEALLHAVLPIPVLPTLISSFLALYFLAVEVRLLGLLYYTNRKRLGWFSI